MAGRLVARLPLFDLAFTSLNFAILSDSNIARIRAALCKNLKQMHRHWWIPLALLLTACGPATRPAAVLLPPVVDSWKRESLRQIPPPKAAIVRAFEAAYSGAGALTVELYEAKVSGTAFEMTQRRRPAPDTVFFDQGRYFVVVTWKQADRQSLKDFVRKLESGLKE